MTNEQREAIEELKSLSPSEGAIDIVLSLIKEQQEEMEGVKDKEVLIKRYFNKCDLIKQKDKQIDLMAKEITMTKPTPCTRTNEFSMGRMYMSKEEIKQYFADLVEKE